MEERQHCAQHALCSTCRRERKANLTVRGVLPPGRILLLALSLSFCLAEGSPTETLCGAELVDTLQFVCGERGFHISRPNRQRGRHQGGLWSSAALVAALWGCWNNTVPRPVSQGETSADTFYLLFTRKQSRGHTLCASLCGRSSQFKGCAVVCPQGFMPCDTLS